CGRSAPSLGLSLGGPPSWMAPPPRTGEFPNVDTHPDLPAPPPRPDLPPCPPAHAGAGGPPGADLAAAADLPAPAQPAAFAAAVEPDGRLPPTRPRRLHRTRSHLRVPAAGPIADRPWGPERAGRAVRRRGAAYQGAFA